MTIKEYIKKRLSVFIVSSISIIAILGISFYNVLNNKSGDIVIKDNISYKIETTKKEKNNYPMSKEEGVEAANVHKITISNKDSKRSNFEVVLKDKNSSSLIDKVYYKIDNREVKQINKNHVLYYGTLEKGESKTIEVRFWLGSDLITNDDQGKKASIYIDVYGK